jgi:hypothetical protein
LVAQEPATTAWFGIRLGETSFAIFAAFADDAGRDAHLSGKVAKALMWYRKRLTKGESPPPPPLPWSALGFRSAPPRSPPIRPKTTTKGVCRAAFAAIDAIVANGA